MRTRIGLLGRDDLHGAALLFAECEASGRGEQEAREWLRELLEDPGLVAVVARARGRVVGIALASSTSWSERGASARCELCLDPAHAALEPRLHETLELALQAESLQRRAA
jgi:hypothetical protein